MILDKQKYDKLLDKIIQNPIENIRLIYFLKYNRNRIEKIISNDPENPTAIIMEIKGASFSDHNNATLWADNENGLSWIKHWKGVDYPLMFVAIKENIYNEIQDAWSIDGSPAEMWFLPDDVPVKTPNYTVEQLKDRESDIEEVNQHWTYSNGHIQEYIRQKIRDKKTYAIYLDGLLASYAIDRENGAMGMLRTIPEFRGKGLAKSITYAMIRNIREDGRTPHCFILPDNTPSQKVVQDSGFVKDGRFYWFHVDPNER